MLFLRTAVGSFVNAPTIVRLCEETDGWVAICDDDREIALAAYFYSMPGRLKELQHLLPPQGISSRPGPPAEEAAYGPAGCDCAF
jgi:hypothetical protein